jgi:Ser/Thr protein kinase RdoA (MazF antagonist)
MRQLSRTVRRYVFLLPVEAAVYPRQAGPSASTGAGGFDGAIIAARSSCSMNPHDRLLGSLQAALRRNLGRWGLSSGTRLTLLNLSENTVFLAEDGACRLVLRVHRCGYHRPEEIAAELAWIAALREADVLETPAPVPATDGRLILTLRLGETHRSVVAFQHAPGRSPEPQDDLTGWFARLGAVTARLHAQARHWTRPDDFARKRWTVETMLGPRGHWGDWRQACGLSGAGEALLARTAAAIGTALARYGTAPDRFGLIHGDLRLANLLVDGDRLSVIDFDDCGFGWFLYDFAAAVSFFEDAPTVPALMAAWVEGYRRLAPLSAEDLGVLPALILLRRMLLLAWVASHPEAPTAQGMGQAYTEGALTLADRFLTSR